MLLSRRILVYSKPVLKLPIMMRGMTTVKESLSHVERTAEEPRDDVCLQTPFSTPGT